MSLEYKVVVTHNQAIISWDSGDVATADAAMVAREMGATLCKIFGLTWLAAPSNFSTQKGCSMTWNKDYNVSRGISVATYARRMAWASTAERA